MITWWRIRKIPWITDGLASTSSLATAGLIFWQKPYVVSAAGCRRAECTEGRTIWERTGLYRRYITVQRCIMEYFMYCSAPDRYNIDIMCNMESPYLLHCHDNINKVCYYCPVLVSTVCCHNSFLLFTCGEGFVMCVCVCVCRCECVFSCVCISIITGTFSV